MFTLGMTEKHQTEVELVGMSYVGLKAVVDFLYSGELLLDGGNIYTVLQAAHLLQVWRVVDFCCQYLEKEVSEENYLDLQELALTYSLERLDVFIDRFILRRFATLSFTPAFRHNIPLAKLISYLSSDQVQHGSEQLLLQAALKWLSHTLERQQCATQLLSCVRFPLVPAGELVDSVLPALRAVMSEHERYEALLKEALKYHASRSAQPLLQTERTVLRGGVERLLLVGGEISEHSEELSASVCWLDSQSGSWEVETKLPAQRSHLCLAVLGGFIYAAGGSSSRDSGGDTCNLLYRYDPRHSCWTTGAAMNHRRVAFYLGTLADSLIAVGGRNNTTALSSVEVYHPAEDCWTDAAALPRLTYGHAGTVHHGVVYISGGHDTQIGPYRQDVLSYEPSQDAWVECQPMSVARGWHCMASLNHLIYAIGGSDDHEDTTERFDILDVESLDPRYGQWTQVAPLLLPNSEAGLAVWGSQIYVLGGYSWERMVFSRATQVYDPDQDSWSRGFDLPKCTAGASACVCTVKHSSLSSSSDRKKVGTG
ncbi:kelch-like protein 36 isoform X2 [Thalassophryne amazonica]|nr:kelch-like protein 36 isoform X2 [Thalassophryne amazonica]